MRRALAYIPFIFIGIVGCSEETTVVPGIDVTNDVSELFEDITPEPDVMIDEGDIAPTPEIVPEVIPEITHEFIHPDGEEAFEVQPEAVEQPVCGNGIVEEGEECDDGNTDSCGTCNEDCTKVQTPGKDCPAGTGCASDDDCLSVCDSQTHKCVAKCGDGIVDGETCDDGNELDCGTCSADCSMEQIGGDCPLGAGCATAADCESGNCAGGTCAPMCGNGIIEPGEVCDDRNNLDCDGCRGDCSAVETGCGDGFVCGPEVCDDGNNDDCDGCRGDCSAIETGCGDGFLCGDEVCDDGNTDSCGTCNEDCTKVQTPGKDCPAGTGCASDDDCLSVCDSQTHKCVAKCGDGIVDGETCDDGNELDCGTCSADCSMEQIGGDCPLGAGCATAADCESGNCAGGTCAPMCGNGIKEPGEVCDDGNNLDCDGCRGDCSAIETGCGDGFLCGDEVCDDGNNLDCDGCRGDCSAIETGCGDGFLCGDEVCDDGNNLDCDGCRGDCSAIETGCGDGFLCGDEVCDDGNNLDCDGCRGDCSAVETGCGDGFLCGDEVCDDGNNLDCDGCRGDCSAIETGCGDGFLCGDEVCDDGNNLDCDGCRGDCSAIETGCGDGFLCGDEVCDDGNNLDCDGCRGDCSAVETGCGDGFVCWPEVCDTNELFGLTCQGLGYPAGNLGCSQDCLSYDTSHCKNLFFSEYVEGSSYNKALEIYNASGHAVDLTGCELTQYNCGTTCSSVYTVSLSGIVPAGSVVVYCNSQASTTLLNRCNVVSQSSVFNFNGDDTLVLSCDGVILDAIGQQGVDPGSEWGSGNTSTADNTIRRKCSVITGDTNPSDPFDPAIEWDGYPQDTFDDLGQHCGTLPSVGWCILQWPIDFTLSNQNPSETIYGQLWVSGLTDLDTAGPDTHARVIAQWGFGMDAEHVTLALAKPNHAFPAVPPSNNDEYMFTVSLPLAQGLYHHAYRFSTDGGITWLECDFTGSPPFSPEDVGTMTVAP